LLDSLLQEIMDHLKLDIENDPLRTLLEFQQNSVYTDLQVSCSNGTLNCHRALMSLCFTWTLPEEFDHLLLPNVDINLFKERLEGFYLSLDTSWITDLLYNSPGVVQLSPDDPRDGLSDGLHDYTKPFSPADAESRQDKGVALGEDHERETVVETKKLPEVLKEKKQSSCDMCDKVFRSLHQLKRHKRQQHARLEEYSCDYCGYKTKSNKNLQRHIENSHLGGIKYSCPTCGLLYASKSSLYMHSKVHSDERPFVCTECGDRFKWKKNLEAHIDNRHSKIMYTCVHCHRQFKSQNSLEYHSKSHDISQQFPCEVCGKRFVTKTKLKMHKNTHTGERPYKCTNVMCERSYHSSDQLSHHKKSCNKLPSIIKVKLY